MKKKMPANKPFNHLPPKPVKYSAAELKMQRLVEERRHKEIALNSEDQFDFLGEVLEKPLGLKVLLSGSSDSGLKYEFSKTPLNHDWYMKEGTSDKTYSFRLKKDALLSKQAERIIQYYEDHYISSE